MAVRGRAEGREDARQRRWTGEGGRSLDAASLLGRCGRIGPDHWGFFGKANQSVHAGPETQRRGSSLPRTNSRAASKLLPHSREDINIRRYRYAFSAAAGLIEEVSQMMIIHSGSRFPLNPGQRRPRRHAVTLLKLPLLQIISCVF